MGAQRTPIKDEQLSEAIQIVHDFTASGRDAMHGVSTENTQIAHLVSKAEIAKNGEYNLSGERYRTIQDLSATEFEIVKIGDIFKTSSGGTPLKDKEEYYKNGNIPWLRSGEVAQGFITSSEFFITEKGLKNSSAKIFPIDTVLVAMYGATAGQVGILKFEACTNQAVCGILPNDKAIPEYLYLVLKSQKDYMISLSGGGAQPNISQTIIRNLQIPLPPISIQEEIVAEIEAYQKIIDGAKAVVENYKPHIDIDPDWEMVELEEVCEVIMGQSPNGESYNNTGEGIPLINGPVEFGGKDPFDKTVKTKFTTQPTKMCKENDLILCVRGATTGRTNIAGFDACIGRGVAAIRANENQNWINYCIVLNRKKILSLGSGSTFPNITSKELLKLEIPFPSITEQEVIVSQIEKEQELVNANKQLIEIFEQKIKDRIAKVWGE